jgi:hypothetical protein
MWTWQIQNRAKWQNVENLQSAKNGNEIAFVESKIDPTTEDSYFLRQRKNWKIFWKKISWKIIRKRKSSFSHTICEKEVKFKIPFKVSQKQKQEKGPGVKISQIHLVFTHYIYLHCKYCGYRLMGSWIMLSIG